MLQVAVLTWIIIYYFKALYTLISFNPVYFNYIFASVKAPRIKKMNLIYRKGLRNKLVENIIFSPLTKKNRVQPLSIIKE